MASKKAVLIGHNFNSILGLARSLGSEGYEVGTIRTGVNNNSWIKRIGETPEASSKYIKKYRIASTKNADRIISLLINDFADHGAKCVLIPVDDICAEIIDERMNELRPYYYMPNVDDTPGGVVRLMDKYYQKQLAREAGLKVSNGVSITIENGEYTIPKEIQYPCFAKSQMPMPARKNYMGKCNNIDELNTLLKKAAAYRDCIMIVEDYVAIEKEYCVHGVCDRDNVFIPAVIDEVILGHGAHAGVDCCGKVIPPSKFDLEFIKKLKVFLCSTHFKGIFDVDFFKSGEELYFGELNVRIGGSGIAVIGAGVNIGKIAADVLQGAGCGELDRECSEISFVSERPLINDLVNHYISWREYKAYLSKADYRFVESEDDKGPQRHFKWYVISQYARNMKKLHFNKWNS